MGDDDVATMMIVGELKANDVLLGRGTGPNFHVGNVRFRKLIRKHYEKYQHATLRGQKTLLAKKIVDVVHRSQGRFLRKLLPSEMSEEEDSDDAYAVISDPNVLSLKTKLAFQHCIRMARDHHPHHCEVIEQQEDDQSASNRKMPPSSSGSAAMQQAHTHAYLLDQQAASISPLSRANSGNGRTGQHKQEQTEYNNNNNNNAWSHPLSMNEAIAAARAKLAVREIAEQQEAARVSLRREYIGYLQLDIAREERRNMLTTLRGQHEILQLRQTLRAAGSAIAPSPLLQESRLPSALPPSPFDSILSSALQRDAMSTNFLASQAPPLLAQLAVQQRALVSASALRATSSSSILERQRAELFLRDRAGNHPAAPTVHRSTAAANPSDFMLLSHMFP